MSRRQRRLTQPTSRGDAAPGQDSQVNRDFREAVHHLKEGRLQQSEQAHRRVLARMPRHAPSLHHLGLIAFRNKDQHEAIDYIRQSLEIDPKSHQAWLNLAVVLGEARRVDEAIEACRQSMELAPPDAKSYDVLGNLLRAAKKEADAIIAYSESLKLKADQPKVLTKMGELLLHAGRPDDAMALCRQALALDPDLAGAHLLERRILASTGQPDAAEAMIEAQTSDPAERARLYDELGLFLRARKKFAEALRIQRRAVAYAPDKADYHFNLAAALDGVGQKREALSAYQAGLALEPERADGYAKVGALLRSMDMHAGAITALEHAVKLNPDLVNAHYDLGITYKLMHRLDEAIASLKRACKGAPESVVFRFELGNLRRMVCDWEGIEEEERRCIELAHAKESCVAPFMLLSMPSSRADQLQISRRFAQGIAAPEERRFRSHQTGAGRDGRIRIGYLSADFFAHATAFLLAEVLEKTDKTRFELFGYCYSPDGR
jgi:protein O-GlcNAc transferase